MLRLRQERGRTRRIPGPQIQRLAPTYHPRHARPLIPGHHRTQSQKRGPEQHLRIAEHDHPPANPAEPDTTAPKPRGLIALTIAEIRRLLNARRRHHHNESADLAHVLHWSTWRREHQAQA